MRRYAAELLRRSFGSIRAIRSSSSVHPQKRRCLARSDVVASDTFAPTNLGWSLVDLPRAARRERLDVFHAPAYTAPLRGVHPLALTIHDVSYERHPEWYPYRRDPLRRWFYRRSARTADLIITDSEFSRQRDLRCIRHSIRITSRLCRSASARRSSAHANSDSHPA